LQIGRCFATSHRHNKDGFAGRGLLKDLPATGQGDIVEMGRKIEMVVMFHHSRLGIRRA
jgi:hypothetical protein